jgi:hypothetical protein
VAAEPHRSPEQPGELTTPEARTVVARRADARISDELDEWLQGEHDKTLGGLIDVFDKRAFAFVFVLLLGPSALPLPTGGVTNVLEIVAVLLALELIAGRDTIWLPRRWCAREIATDGRFVRMLLTTVRRIERLSRPRLRFLFGHRLSNIVFGAVVVAGTIAAFVAPPFSGLDTLPSLGVVLVSLGVLSEDALFVAVGIVVAAAGIALEIVAGGAAFRAFRSLF